MKKKKLLILISLMAAFMLLITACGGGSSAAGASNGTSQSGNASQNPASQAQPNAMQTGASNFDTTKNISVITREDGSGTKSAFMEIIGLKGSADPANVIIQTSTAGVLTEVKGNPAAIAYESLGYVTEEVKMLKVEGVEATTDNIKNGAYKISRHLSVVYKEAALDDDVNKAFFTFLQSSDAQRIITEEGYVALADGTQPYTINGSLSGSIDISGSTSLQPLMTELATAFEALQQSISVSVSGGGSGTGYQNAEEAVSAFGMISEEFSLEKAPSCTHHVICKDGIAVIVHKDNPLESISMDELKEIYDVNEEAGAMGKWNALIK